MGLINDQKYFIYLCLILGEICNVESKYILIQKANEVKSLRSSIVGKKKKTPNKNLHPKKIISEKRKRF
jgi:hypothetical protein